jgi:hypothetical protein
MFGYLQKKQFHTVGIAAVYWAIWKVQNRTCFQGKPQINSVFIIEQVFSKNWTKKLWKLE